MEFIVKGMKFLSVEKRVSKKQNSYLIGNFLASDGKIIQCMIDCELPNDLKQLDKIDITFRIILGRYMRLLVINIVKVA